MADSQIDSSDDENNIEKQEKEDKISAKVSTAVSKEEREIERERQFYVYKSTESFYWRCLNNLKKGHVCGLIICVHSGICYILADGRCLAYRPKYSCDTKLVGCWLTFKLDGNEQIHSIPEYLEPPLHTRVFETDTIPYLLIYEYVEFLNSTELNSGFLGRIHNTFDLRGKRGQQWKNYNVEYTIRCSFDDTIFKHETNVVKLHGSVSLHTDLPQILSFITHNGEKSGYKKELFEDAVYSIEEQKSRKEERIKQLHKANAEKSRKQMNTLFPKKSDNIESNLREEDTSDAP